MNDRYENLIKELRFRYHKKYKVELDDEILYIIIRINELQVDLKKDIKKNPPLTFPKSSDYLFYGLGKAISYLVAGIGFAFLGILIFAAFHNTGNPKIIEKKGEVLIQVQAQKVDGGDTTLNIPIK